jgi:hypothetical protein
MARITTRQATLDRLHMEAYVHAVDTARSAGLIQRRVRKEEFWTGHTIVQVGDGSYRVYSDSAWVEPIEAPMLPWSAPTGTPVARVGLDGTVRAL